MRFIGKHRLAKFGFGIALLFLAIGLQPDKALAACSQPTTFGTVSFSNVSVPETGNYRVWTRMQIPSSANNSFFLEVNNGNCITVQGNSTIPVNTWTWVDWQSGTTSNKINVALTAGSSTSIEMIGASEGVLVDRVIFTKIDANGETCTPSGTGNDCAEPANAAPTFSSFSSSTSSTTAGTNYTLTANANDSNGTINNISIYQTGVATALKSCPATTASASCAVTVSNATAATYTYYAKATDSGGAITTSSNINVVVAANPVLKKGDTNNNGVTDGTDLIAVLTHWKQTGRSRLEGDLTGEGTVDGSDLIEVLTGWKN